MELKTQGDLPSNTLSEKCNSVGKTTRAKGTFFRGLQLLTHYLGSLYRQGIIVTFRRLDLLDFIGIGIHPRYSTKVV